MNDKDDFMGYIRRGEFMPRKFVDEEAEGGEGGEGEGAPKEG